MRAVPRVKICGITRVEEARWAETAGADAIGLVFYEPSSRCIENFSLAREIVRAVGPYVTVVGLFVDPTAARVEQVLSEVPLHLLQFHGEETAEFCTQFGRPYVKALRMQPGIDVSAIMARYVGAAGILLDAYRPGVPGGTGETFDWRAVPPYNGQPVVLAGGLTPDNVQQAVRTVNPWAVDVSSGVEHTPGAKSCALIESFVRNAKSVSINR